MYKIINEGKAKLKISAEKKISKELPVFYNPVMKMNRDISVLILKSSNKNNLQIADILAGTGIRSIRFTKELNKNKIKNIVINDINKISYKMIKENLKLNKIKFKEIKDYNNISKNNKIKTSNFDANLLLLHSSGFDYIDIDPFGSPNYFLDAAVKRISREGILAVTATDTGCLCGTFKEACERKYWAMPQKNSTMYENALRILIRKIQLIGAEHDKALIPIFSYMHEHYFRVFFFCGKGKEKADEIIRQHGMSNNAGPLWLGQLWDKKLADNVYQSCKDKEIKKFLYLIKNESKINSVGYYNLPEIFKKYKLKQMKKEILFEKIQNKGFNVSNTHFDAESIRSDINLKELLEILK